MPKSKDITRLVPRNIDQDESKSDRFRRLANQRFRVLKAAMTRMGRLSGPSYDASTEQIDKLIEALTREFDFMIAQLHRKVDSDAPDDLF